MISNVVLSFKGDAEKFDPAFCKCISDAENPLGGTLNKHASLMLGFELVLVYLPGGCLEKDKVVQFKYSFAYLSDNKKSVLFCLARLVFTTYSRRLTFAKNIIKIAQKCLRNI